MNTVKPRSLVLVEDNPASVASYNIQLRALDGETVLASGNTASDPSGTTEISLGIPGGLLAGHPELVGQSITIYVQEVGPGGDVSDFQLCSDPDGHGQFAVVTMPNGAEGRTVHY